MGVKDIFNILIVASNILAIFFSKSFKILFGYLYLLGSRVISNKLRVIFLFISLTFNLYIFSNSNPTRYVSIPILYYSPKLGFRNYRVFSLSSFLAYSGTIFRTKRII